MQVQVLHVHHLDPDQEHNGTRAVLELVATLHQHLGHLPVGGGARGRGWGEDKAALHMHGLARALLGHHRPKGVLVLEYS